jgi:hypothetical protein
MKIRRWFSSLVVFIKRGKFQSSWSRRPPNHHCHIDVARTTAPSRATILAYVGWPAGWRRPSRVDLPPMPPERRSTHVTFGSRAPRRGEARRQRCRGGGEAAGGTRDDPGVAPSKVWFSKRPLIFMLLLLWDYASLILQRNLLYIKLYFLKLACGCFFIHVTNTYI